MSLTYFFFNFVVTAVDNFEARKFLNSRCLLYMLPLFDSGYFGNKGHVDVILPDKT